MLGGPAAGSHCGRVLGLDADVKAKAKAKVKAIAKVTCWTFASPFLLLLFLNGCTHLIICCIEAFLASTTWRIRGLGRGFY